LIAAADTGDGRQFPQEDDEAVRNVGKGQDERRHTDPEDEAREV
jgi:hypothetical protein